MKNNIRELCLVLDLECKKVLPLMTMDGEQLDKYIFEHFEDSKAIRNYFQEKIHEYLQKNKNYLENVHKNSGRKTEGSIVILINNGYSSTRKTVLYKSRIKEIQNFLTLKSKSEALMKEDFISYLLKNNHILFFSNYEIDVLNRDYKHYSKLKKQEFLFFLFNNLKERILKDNDKIRDFYNILKKYRSQKTITKPIEEPIPKITSTTLENEEIDPDRIYLDTPTIYPVSDDKLDEYDKEEKGHSLKYTYKPYHRR